jgi:protein ImuB
VTLDLKGFRNLSVEAYGQKMIGQLRLLHLRAQVGVAENPLLAFYAARCTRAFLAVEHSKEFLGNLRIEVIAPSPETLLVLKKWGIYSVGNFMALGKEDVADRLGAEALGLFERALANATRPLRLISPPDRFEEAIEFENEIETTEPLLFVLRRFVEQISVRLEIAGRVAEEIALRLIFSAGPDYTHVFKVPEPTRNIDTLFRMLNTHLENLKSEHTIIGLHLAAKPCLATNYQLGLFESALRDPNRFYETLARLSALVGTDGVGTPVVESTHTPDAFRMQPVNFQINSRGPSENGSGRREADPSAKTSSALLSQPDLCTGREPSPFMKGRGRGFARLRSSTSLPLRRFRPPVSAEVELSDSRPVQLKTADVNHAIREAHGPWRSSGHWWDRNTWARDEWDVQAVDGSLYRLFEQDGDWFVEGVYD